MDKKEIRCMVNAEVADKLNIVLQLNKENMDDVVEKLLTNYISESFMNAAKGMVGGISKPVVSQITQPVVHDDPNYGKANRKIPVWARRPNQNNHKIIKAFFLIEEEQGEVLYDELVSRCTNREHYLETWVADFKGNFTQMKTDASNSHGKVFLVEEDKVVIWDEVFETLMRFKGEFLNSDSERTQKVKITNEMVQGAYEIAKMAYAGDIGRNDAKFKVIEETGMGAGSAGDYIQNFRSMMEGQRYTRTLSAYSTQYYLEHIREDFGEEQFQKALRAVKEHIKYYNSLPYGNLTKVQEVVDSLM